MDQSRAGNIATFTVFSIKKGAYLWAFQQMGLLPGSLKKVPGLLFFKLMGSGKGKAFSLSPDWSRYMLLAVWETKEDANSFFNNSAISLKYYANCDEVWTVTLKSIQSKGLWDGINPFLQGNNSNSINAPLGVLTRGSVRLLKLPGFWKHALSSSSVLDQQEGLLFSCGVGELPYIRQVTFSIWSDFEAMKHFAYGSEEHKEAIRQRVKQNWYSEELFARFIIVGASGTINGKNPLEKYL